MNAIPVDAPYPCFANSVTEEKYHRYSSKTNERYILHFLSIFMSLLWNIAVTLIPSSGKQRPYSIPWLLISWQYNKSGHQHYIDLVLVYFSCSTGGIDSPECRIYASVNWVSIGSDNQWFVSYSVRSHNLNQCWIIVNWTLGNKLQWNLIKIKKLFIHENTFESVICEMVAILSRGDSIYVLSSSGSFVVILR